MATNPRILSQRDRDLFGRARMANFESSAMIQESQAALRDFLRVDIEISFTILRSVNTTRDPRHRDRSLATVRRALSMIRSQLGRVYDPAERTRIAREADRLEKAMTLSDDGRTADTSGESSV